MDSSEYWASTPAEISLIFEYNRPKKVGYLHEDDYEDLYEARAELEAQGYKVG